MIYIQSVTGGLLKYFNKNGSSFMGIFRVGKNITGLHVFLCFFFKDAASLQRPTAVHFLMRLSVCTVNTVILSRCTAEQQWMLLKCNKWLLYWLTSGLVPAWWARFGETAIIMNELTQFINQKKRGPTMWFSHHTVRLFIIFHLPFI